MKWGDDWLSDKEVAGWRNEVVQPLRSVRRHLKDCGDPAVSIAAEPLLKASQICRASFRAH
jgi:hypothetical protein